MSIFPSSNQPQGPDLRRIRDAIAATDPARARAQVEEMLRTGRLSQGRFEELAGRAREIAALLGIR